MPIDVTNGLVLAELNLWSVYMETIQGNGKTQKGAKVIQTYVGPCFMINCCLFEAERLMDQPPPKVNITLTECYKYVHTVFENHPKCRIFHQFLSY